MTHLIRPPTAFSATKRPRQKHGDHLAFIRTLPSLIPGDGPVEAAHIRYGEPRYGKPITGMGEKPSDQWTVPLCHEAHMRQHAGSERQFWIEESIDPLLIAALLWLHSGDHEMAAMVIANAHSIGRN